MKATGLLLAALSVAIGPLSTEGPLLRADSPEAELEITLDQLAQPNTFHLSATNRGALPVLVVRPRVHMLDQMDSWGGWSLRVQGTGGPFHAFPFPGGVPPFTSLDLVELRPKESIGVVLDLSNFTPDGNSRLTDLPGKYTAVAIYHLEQDKVVSAIGDGFVAVPRLAATESKAIRFVVVGKGKATGPVESPPRRRR